MARGKCLSHQPVLTALQTFAGTLFFLPALFMATDRVETAFSLPALLAVLISWQYRNRWRLRALQLRGQPHPRFRGQRLHQPDPGICGGPWVHRPG